LVDDAESPDTRGLGLLETEGSVEDVLKGVDGAGEVDDVAES